MISLMAAFLTVLPLVAFGFATPKSTTTCSPAIENHRSPLSSALYDVANSDIIQENNPLIRNDDNEVTGTVDRAPCFDGICDSQPIDGEGGISNDLDAGTETRSASIDSNEHAGGAILRLGTMTGPTVWSEFGRISQEHDVANLGQGVFNLR